ncbi:MAG: ribosome-associated translation inhibitor RaiA [Dehalococcoidia bacterium]|nr:ribosome-associated translation inhibitor RaiA [Dehalococcoidia bacterium]
MQQLILKGKNVEISQALRDYIAKKIDRLSRHLERIQETKVELARENTKSQEDRYAAQVTISTNHTILRAEERGEDLRVVVDQAIDALDRRIGRYKGKLHSRSKRANAERALTEPSEETSETEDLELDKVVRHKRFSVKPMYPEEAAEQMELLGHVFFVFFNAANEQMCVIYRRKNGDYGLLEPELG